MQLQELLRKVNPDVPFIFFDMNGIEMFFVSRKDQISTDYYEYDIYDIGIGPSKTKNKSTAFYITLVK